MPLMIKSPVGSNTKDPGEQRQNHSSQQTASALQATQGSAQNTSRPSTAEGKALEQFTDPINYAVKAIELADVNGSLLPENPWNSQTVLALDGGGVRGYTTLRILEALTDKIAIVEKELDSACISSAWPLGTRNRINGPPTPAHLPCRYFDYIAGTSSGGILAIMLGRLRMSPSECLQAYRELVDDVFGHPRLFHLRSIPLPRNKFHHERLEKAIKRVVREFDHTRSEETSFRQPCEDMCRTIVIAFRKVAKGRVEEPYLFRSYKHPKPKQNNFYDCNPGDDNTQPIWKIARATSAAPFSFDSIKFEQNGDVTEWLDGGLGCCNPSEEAYRDTKQLFNNGSDVVNLVVSIGTGKTEFSRRGRLLGYGKFIDSGNVIVDLVTQCERTHKNMQRTLNADKVPYYRLNIKKGLGTMALDCWKGKGGQSTVERMNAAAEAYLKSNEAQNSIEELARRLVTIRRARARFADRHSDRWERFCHGVSYVCGNGTCGRKFFFTRYGFEVHVRNDHKGLLMPESRLETLLNEILDGGRQYLLFEEDEDGEIT